MAERPDETDLIEKILSRDDDALLEEWLAQLDLAGVHRQELIGEGELRELLLLPRDDRLPRALVRLDDRHWPWSSR